MSVCLRLISLMSYHQFQICRPPSDNAAEPEQMRWVRRGSKHSKNAGTMGSESQTYHERRAMGHGTVRERLGKARSRVPAACPPLPVLARPLLSALNEHLLLAHIARRCRHQGCESRAPAGRCRKLRRLRADVENSCGEYLDCTDKTVAGLPAVALLMRF